MHARTHARIRVHVCIHECAYVCMHSMYTVHCTVYIYVSMHVCTLNFNLPSLLILRGYAWKKYYRVWAPTFSSTFAPMYAFMYAPEQEQILSLEARPHFDENLEPTSITINRTEFRFDGRWLSHPIICGSRGSTGTQRIPNPDRLWTWKVRFRRCGRDFTGAAPPQD